MALIHTLLYAVLIFLQVVDWLVQMKVLSKGTYQVGTVLTKIMGWVGLSAGKIVTISKFVMIGIAVFCFFYALLAPTILIIIATLIYLYFVIHGIVEWVKSGSVVVASTVVTETPTNTVDSLILQGENLLDEAKLHLQTTLATFFTESGPVDTVITDLEKVEHALVEAVNKVLTEFKLEKASS